MDFILAKIYKIHTKAVIIHIAMILLLLELLCQDPLLLHHLPQAHVLSTIYKLQIDVGFKPFGRFYMNESLPSGADC